MYSGTRLFLIHSGQGVVGRHKTILFQVSSFLILEQSSCFCHELILPFLCVCFLGNLTKHMKSKAHMKKCLELGVSMTSVDDTETEEAGTSKFS